MGFDGPKSDRISDADAFILMSGGVDSMLCAHFMREKGYKSQGLFVDYGQRAAGYEKRSAKAISERLGLLPLVSVSAGRVADCRGGEIPGRNAFLIFSAMTLGGISRGLLVIGVHAGAGYYDCTSDFIRGTAEIVSAYTDGTLRLIAPLKDWMKPDILAFVKDNNLPIHLTYSCEAGVNPPCGKCLSCKDRRRMGC